MEYKLCEYLSKVSIELLCSSCYTSDKFLQTNEEEYSLFKEIYDKTKNFEKTILLTTKIYLKHNENRLNEIKELINKKKEEDYDEECDTEITNIKMVEYENYKNKIGLHLLRNMDLDIQFKYAELFWEAVLE